MENKLREREIGVIEEVLKHSTYREASSCLLIAEKTISTHIANSLRVMEARNMTELAFKLHKEKIIDLEKIFNEDRT